MNFTRRAFGTLALGLASTVAFATGAFAADMPKPFDKPGDVKIALVRYLSTGDFFQSYLAGVEAQAKALGVQLQVLDSRQDAALQADMVDQAIALGVQGIIIQHGLTESMKEAAKRAVDAGIKVVAFDVNVENDKIPGTVLDFGERLLSCPRLGHVQVLERIGEHLFESDPDDRMIVNQKNPQSCDLRAGDFNGGLRGMGSLIRQHRA